MNALILGLDQIDKSHVALVGGKGAHLGELAKKWDVPPGFVVTTEFFKAFKDKNPHLGKFLKALQESNDKEYTTFVSNRLQQILSLQNKGMSVVDAQYYNRGLGTVAVRSSAVDEDGANTSFAGQHSTFLGIRGGTDVTNKTLNCMLSLYEPRAIEYRKANGLTIEDATMAVVIQSMVDSMGKRSSFLSGPQYR